MPFLRIALGATFLSLLAAILRDFALARISPDYFTLRPNGLADADAPLPPVLIGAVFTSGGMALAYGLGLACAARLGRRPKRPARDLRKPVALLLGLIAAFALLAGVFGYLLASTGTVILNPDVKDRLPPQKWPGFQACWFVHTMGNYVGCIGGGMQIAYVWVSRKRFVKGVVKK